MVVAKEHPAGHQSQKVYRTGSITKSTCKPHWEHPDSSAEKSNREGSPPGPPVAFSHTKVGQGATERSVPKL